MNRQVKKWRKMANEIVIKVIGDVVRANTDSKLNRVLVLRETLRRLRRDYWDYYDIDNSREVIIDMAIKI